MRASHGHTTCLGRAASVFALLSGGWRLGRFPAFAHQQNDIMPILRSLAQLTAGTCQSLVSFGARHAGLALGTAVAAISRLDGGIHDGSDIEVGKVHGARVGGYTVRFARLDGADGR
jgi:hypothetical protein